MHLSLRGGVPPIFFSKTDFEIGLVRGRYTQGATFETKFGQNFQKLTQMGPEKPEKTHVGSKYHLGIGRS